MNASTGMLGRIANRLQHGLMTQEVLDRLARRGLRIYPYFIVHEQPLERPELARSDSGLEMRFLDRAELHHVSDIPARPRRLQGLEKRQEHGGCLGVWDGSRLAAYSWYSSKGIPAAAGGYDLCPLPPAAAYLYDAYVLPDYRGRRLAVVMRHRLHHMLVAHGMRSFFSITLAFNQSSRRFKSRLGAREFETRILATIGNAGGIDLRLARREERLETPRLKRLGSDDRTESASS